MSEDAPKPDQGETTPPVSTFTGPIAELIGQRLLSPPSRPGLLATLDHFEILRVLGGGGMGIVLLARDAKTGREVAIKLIKSDLAVDQQIVNRFVKEAGHLRRLRHEHVVQVLEISDRPQGPYFVMPYFEKGSLARRIQAGRALESETILDIAVPVAEGLQFAHRRGIIHRDLKPANILLDAGGRACLADFGLARSVFNDTIVDAERQPFEGTAPYMSPAVVAGNAEDTRCDIYAFGAVLYEMLTGESPYKGGTPKEIRERILAGPPKSIAALNPGADQGLVAVAEGAMARELRDRYADMTDVLEDLRRIREGKPPVGPHGISSGVRNKLLRGGRIPKNLWIPVSLAVLAALSSFFWPSEHAKAPIVAPRVGSNGSVIPLPAPPAAPSTLTFRAPWGIAVDGAHDVYVSDKDNYTIWKITPAGMMTDLAGLAGSPGTADGIGSNARFALPRGVALDAAGNAYVADSCVIRKVTPQGAVTLLAGRVRSPGTADGVGVDARFELPSGVAVDRAGNVYVADRYTIRKITPDAVVTTLAGMEQHAGSADGPGGKAQFSDHEKGIAVDSAGNVYVGDTFNHMVRKITPEGLVTTLAGSTHSGSVDGTGRNARFFKPCGLAVDNSGDVFVADSGNHTIRKITPAGMVSTVAGLSGRPGKAAGSATNALFDDPRELAMDGATGDLYVADIGNHLVRKMTPAGVVSSLTGEIPRSPASTDGGAKPADLPAGVEAVVRLTQAGVSEAVILVKIRTEAVAYKLTDEQIIYLGNQGVTENVIIALLEGK